MSGIFISIRGRQSSKTISAVSVPSSAPPKTSTASSRPSEVPAPGCAMPRRWVDLLRTTSARLALLSAGLFGGSVSLLFGLIYWAATTALGDRIDQDLAIQRDALIAQAGTNEKEGVAAAVAAVLQRSHGEFRYLVSDAAETTLAGDLPPSSTWHAGYQDLELASDTSRSEDEPHLLRALGQPLAGGGILIVGQDAHAVEE